MVKTVIAFTIYLIYARRENICCVIHGAIPKRPIAKTAPKILMPKKLSKTAHCVVQNGPSYNQNGPLSLSAFGNVQSDLEILYVEASYTWVRGLDDSETVKCSAMHCGVTCSKFTSVNGNTVCKIATQHHTHPTQIKSSIPSYILPWLLYTWCSSTVRHS